MNILEMTFILLNFILIPMSSVTLSVIATFINVAINIIICIHICKQAYKSYIRSEESAYISIVNILGSRYLDSESRAKYIKMLKPKYLSRLRNFLKSPESNEPPAAGFIEEFWDELSPAEKERVVFHLDALTGKGGGIST